MFFLKWIGFLGIKVFFLFSNGFVLGMFSVPKDVKFCVVNCFFFEKWVLFSFLKYFP